MKTELKDRCARIEESYEFMLAYAAQGLRTEPGAGAGSQIRTTLSACDKALAGLDDGALDAPWKLMDGDREIFETTRWQMLRSIMLNHWYHHRGQLTVYLRALGLAVPSVYGPSADENPFA